MPRNLSLQPSCHPAYLFLLLHSVQQRYVDGEVLTAHLSKEVAFLLQHSRFVSETFEHVESESCRLAEVNGSHP
jgi:hypothetical protein